MNDPITRLETWRNDDPAHHHYLIRRTAVFYVELKDRRLWADDDRVGYGQGETLTEAVDAALEDTGQEVAS